MGICRMNSYCASVAKRKMTLLTVVLVASTALLTISGVTADGVLHISDGQSCSIFSI